ncbi:MAG: hypothetical protein LUC27_07525 [Lachnospiraceae bacterium]|nr:hypothetical protein [Lachnospiraceae bacterium]
MTFTFANEQESMEWKILQYQYPEEELSTPERYNYNANWLKIQVSHRQEGYGPVVFRESFLMTYELEELINGLKLVAAEEEYYFKAEFIEPVLEVEVARHRDDFHVSFDLFFENYEMMVADTLTQEGLEKMIADLEAMAAEFPER